LALLLANPLTTLPGQTPPNTSQRNDEPKAAARIAEIVAIARNKNDSETLASLFLPEAVLITPTGSVIQSRAAIKQRIIDGAQWKTEEHYFAKTIAGVSLPSGQAAVVRGKYQLHGMKIFGFESYPAGTFVFHQTKQHGRWMISKAEILRQKSD
jgi:ketosteroid isomerase-like protein